MDARIPWFYGKDNKEIDQACTCFMFPQCLRCCFPHLSVGGHHCPLYIMWKAQIFDLSSRIWSNAGIGCAVMWHDEDRQIHASDRSVVCFLKYYFLDAVGHSVWSSQLGNCHPNRAGWLIKKKNQEWLLSPFKKLCNFKSKLPLYPPLITN